MHHLTIDVDTLLTQCVEAALKRIRLKRPPVRHQGLEPVAGHASLPARPEHNGPAIAIQPAAELVKRFGGQLRRLFNDSQAAVIGHRGPS